MSLRAAINAKCRDCVYDPEAKGVGTWRAQVRDCSVPTCPLYPVRPLPTSRRPKTRTETSEADNDGTETQ